MAIYLKVMDSINRLIKAIVVTMFIVMFVSAFLQVILRNFTDIPIPWSDELCRFLMVFVVYLASGLAARNGRLIRMEALIMIFKLSDKWKTILYWIAAIISVIFVTLVCYSSLNVIKVNYRSYSAAMRWSMAIPYSAIPIGSIFMVLNMFAALIEPIVNSKQEEVVEE